MQSQLVLQDKKKASVLPASMLAQHVALRPLTDHGIQTKPIDALTQTHLGQDFSQVTAHTDANRTRSTNPPACGVTPTRCPFGGACHTCPTRVQAKLVISQPGDEYEQEADRVAEMVMRMPEPKKEEKEQCRLPSCTLALQRQTTDIEAPSKVPPIVHEVLRSPGQPLDATTRAFMEPRFGYDLSGVRIHTDKKAAKSAQAVNALAYTVGRNIVFGERTYMPGTSEGRGILAHELTHTVQQDMVPSNLHNLSLDKMRTSSLEQVAESTRMAIGFGNRFTKVTEQTTPEIQRLPGSPAGGCGVCYGHPKNAGSAAHTEIQAAFEALNPRFITEFPLLPSPTDENGRLDLAVLSGPDKIDIGEIKPANPAGLLQGDLDLFWYEEQLKKLGFTVSRLILSPPLAAIPFPTLAPPPCPLTQELYVDPPVHGIYTYWCNPDFTKLVGECPCGKPPPPPVRVREREPVRERAPERHREPSQERQREERERKPNGPEVLVPAFGALLAAAMAWAAKKALGRVAAPATVFAAIVLLANGAEASVGLDGDDALEAMFKMATQKGTPISDDLKDAIKNDPALSRILTNAARAGNFSEAQSQLGEQLTRIIIENRDQFTEEDIQELLRITDDNKDVIPNAPVTIEVLLRSLDAAQSQSGHGRERTVARGSAMKEGRHYPELSAEYYERLSTASEAVRSLFDAMVGNSGIGPHVNDMAVQYFLEIVPNDLTLKQAQQLILRLRSVEGETLNEILEHLRSAIHEISSSERSEADRKSRNTQTTQVAPEVAEQGATGKTEAPTREEPLLTPDELIERGRRVSAELQTWQNLGRGQAGLSSVGILRINQPTSAFLAARANDGVLVGGNVQIMPIANLGGGKWRVRVEGGWQRFNERGIFLGIISGSLEGEFTPQTR